MNLRLNVSFAFCFAALISAHLLVATPAFGQSGNRSSDDGCGASNPVFDFSCEIVDEVGDAATAPVRYAANSAVDTITSWVADSAQWLLGKVINFIDDSTSPDLTAAWFTERYRFMIGLAALVLLPMLLLAAIRAVLQQDVSQLLRSFFLYLPAAILGTFVAVFFTQALLEATDALSAAVADGIAGDVSTIFDSVGSGLSNSVGGASPGAPSFAIFFGALLLIIGSFFVWLELLVRSAAVTVSVFFFPLILAGLVWPATARWTKRLIEILMALILSKFVIVAVISLATAALSNPGGGGFGAVMGGAALMLMAAFSPFALLRLMPLVEGAAIEHLQGMGRRPVETARQGGSVNQAVSIMRSKVAGGGGSPQMAVAGAGAASKGVTATSVAGAAAAAGLGIARAAKTDAEAPGKRLGAAIDSPRAPDGDKRVGGGVSSATSTAPRTDANKTKGDNRG